jgi:iron-sulfur cluster repair protein YtfE (RIC family)
MHGKRTERAIAKTHGAVKGLRARLGGLTGVFETLAKQHGEVISLIDQLRKTPGRRAALWPELRNALLAHERAEMRVIFPELRMYDQLRPLANQHDAEATELERMIHDLDAELEADAWGNLLDRLADQVQRHVHEEETATFPRAQAALGITRARQLADKVIAAYEALLAAE